MNPLLRLHHDRLIEALRSIADNFDPDILLADPIDMVIISPDALFGEALIDEAFMLIPCR